MCWPVVRPRGWLVRQSCHSPHAPGVPRLGFSGVVGSVTVLRRLPSAAIGRIGSIRLHKNKVRSRNCTRAIRTRLKRRYAICKRKRISSRAHRGFARPSIPAFGNKKNGGNKFLAGKTLRPKLGAIAGGTIIAGIAPATVGSGSFTSTNGKSVPPSLPSSGQQTTVDVSVSVFISQRESETIASSSAGSLGIPSERTRQPTSVTSTSSSIRIPMPR